MNIRSSSELIKDVLLFCRRPQRIDSGASFNFSLMKFHYQPLKSAAYFITSVRCMCVCVCVCVCVASALIDATGFSVFDRDICAKRRYGHRNVLVMTFCPLTHDSNAGPLTALTLDFSILCVIDQVHLKHLLE